MQTAQVPSLLDPETCGEDLQRNAARIFELAPQHCSGCADFHIRSAAHRCAVPPRIIIDRPQLIVLLRNLIKEAAAHRPQIGILIPGSADTAILATCAHAAATLDAAILGRCRFTVLDRCATPLTICREFAEQHGISFTACQEDLGTAQAREADLIVLHSTFRFIKHADHVQMLDRLGSWLAPKGRLVFSNRIRLVDEQAEGEAEMRRRTIMNRTVETALTQGTLSAAESPEAVMGHLKRAMTDWEGLPGEFHSLDEVRALFRKSQLRELSVEGLSWDLAVGPGDVIQRKRVLAVLGRSHEHG